MSRMNKFAYLIVTVVIAMYGNVAFGLTVPQDQCTCQNNPDLGPGCEYTSTVCNVTIGPVVVVSAGTPDTLVGESGTCGNCGNCQHCHTQTPQPSPSVCSLALTVNKTNTWTMSGAVTVGWSEGVVATFQGTVGRSWQWNYSTTLTCGTNALAACTQAVYAAQLQTTKNEVLSVTSALTAETVVGGDNCVAPSDTTVACPSQTMTATGDIIGMAGCSLVSTSYCPNY
jgi:hypothetical protein